MSIIDNIEKKYLFGLTRFVALFFIFVAIIPIIFSALHYSQYIFEDSVALSKAEISQIVKPEKATSSANNNANTETNYNTTQQDTESNPLSGKKLPFILQKHFSSANDVHALKEWLSPFSSAEQDEILKELELVIQQAEKEHVDTRDAVNRFSQFKKIKLAERYQNNIKAQAQNYIFGIAIGSAIITIALFSLILVLLAIERNTRKLNV